MNKYLLKIINNLNLIDLEWVERAWRIWKKVKVAFTNYIIQNLKYKNSDFYSYRFYIYVIINYNVRFDQLKLKQLN